MRHSDVYYLKRSDIKADCIDITTIKTADRLLIELNDHSRAILNKYEAIHFEDGKVLPVISNQKMNVSIRLTLFLLNMTIPYILWQHFYSNLIFNHQKVQDNRRYIWRSRQVTFKERTKYSVIYLVLAVGIAIFSLTIFGSSYIEEAFWLSFAGITTILFPLILLYLYSSKSIRHSYKNISKDKFTHLHIYKS